MKPSIRPSILDAEIFNTKKKLPGERQPVFPEGTPGVSQGVPQEMVKGYQPPAEPEPPAKQAEPKPKPKPKPKVVAAAERGIGPDRGHRSAVPPPPPQGQWPDPPRQQPAAGGWRRLAGVWTVVGPGRLARSASATLIALIRGSGHRASPQRAPNSVLNALERAHGPL